MIEGTAENFERYLSQEKIAFIDFWAKWCGPCKAFSKTFHDIAKQETEVDFVSIDIEREQELAETFQIRSVPHLIVLKKGVVIYSDAGALSKASLLELIEQAKKAEPDKA